MEISRKVLGKSVPRQLAVTLAIGAVFRVEDSHTDLLDQLSMKRCYTVTSALLGGRRLPRELIWYFGLMLWNKRSLSGTRTHE